VSWTKGFKATDCEGHDVVGMLREAIKRRNVSQKKEYINRKESENLIQNIRTSNQKGNSQKPLL